MGDTRETEPEWTYSREYRAVYRRGYLVRGEEDMEALVAAANASASPAPSVEGLAGLSQALPTPEMVRVAIEEYNDCAEYNTQEVNMSAALGAAFALLRESRESRPPVATSDELCPKYGAGTQHPWSQSGDGGDNPCRYCGRRNPRFFPEDWKAAAPAESVECQYCGFSGTAEGVEMHPCDRRDAAQRKAEDDAMLDAGAMGFERVEEPRNVTNSPHKFFCALDPDHEGGCSNLNAEGLARYREGIVPPVAREEKPPGRQWCGWSAIHAPHLNCDGIPAPAASPRRAAIETPHKFTSPTGYGQCTVCDYVEDKPWHRKATAIEKMRVTEQGAKGARDSFEGWCKKTPDTGAILGFMAHTLAFMAAATAAIEYER